MFELYKHIESIHLSCFQEIENDFNDYFTPGPEGAIPFIVPTESNLQKYSYEEWHLTLASELMLKGAQYGERIYIDIEY